MPVKSIPTAFRCSQCEWSFVFVPSEEDDDLSDPPSACRKCGSALITAPVVPGFFTSLMSSVMRK